VCKFSIKCFKGRMMRYQAKQIFLNNPHCGTFFNQRFGKNEEMPSQRHFLNLTNVKILMQVLDLLTPGIKFLLIMFSQVCKEFYCGVRSLRIEKLRN